MVIAIANAGKKGTQKARVTSIRDSPRMVAQFRLVLTISPTVNPELPSLQSHDDSCIQLLRQEIAPFLNKLGDPPDL